MMRYNRLRDLGLSEEQIRDNLLFTSDKVGDLMKSNLNATDAKKWFGAVPPDLSVIARAKASGDGTGADWIYTYLRTYYKDDSRATGWNNLVFPNVGMPHVLWELQGVRAAKFEEEKDPHDANVQEYDSAVADLVAYLDWMGEPVKNKRQRLGVWVLFLMSILVFLTWRLNASFWKEVK